MRAMSWALWALDAPYARPMHETAGSIEWTCMVCGQWRPDAAISVAYRSLAMFEGWKHGEPPPFHVRYCNDRPACTAYATAAGHWTGAPSATPAA